MAEFFDKVPPEIYISAELLAELQALMGLTHVPIQVMRADSCVVFDIIDLLNKMNILTVWPYSNKCYDANHPFFWSNLRHDKLPPTISQYFKWFHKIATTVRLEGQLLIKTTKGLQLFRDGKKGRKMVMQYHGPHLIVDNKNLFNMFLPPKPAVYMCEDISDLIRALREDVSSRTAGCIVDQFKRVFVAPEMATTVSIYDPYNTFHTLLKELRRLYFFPCSPIETKFVKARDEPIADYVCNATYIPITPKKALAFYSSFFRQDITVATIRIFTT